MPASLHDELVAAAEADGVSLNHFVCALLAGAMRWRQGADKRSGKAETEEGADRVGMEAYRRIWRNVWG
jgi:hypothetical protein